MLYLKISLQKAYNRLLLVLKISVCLFYPLNKELGFLQNETAVLLFLEMIASSHRLTERTRFALDFIWYPRV